MKSKAEGGVYILTNPSFPEYVKIGYAKGKLDYALSLFRQAYDAQRRD